MLSGELVRCLLQTRHDLRMRGCAEDRRARTGVAKTLRSAIVAGNDHDERSCRPG